MSPRVILKRHQLQCFKEEQDEAYLVLVVGRIHHVVGMRRGMVVVLLVHHLVLECVHHLLVGRSMVVHYCGGWIGGWCRGWMHQSC